MFDLGISKNNGGGSGQTGPSTASELSIVDSGELFTAANVEAALAEAMTKANSAFTQASDGKTLLETSIEAKGGTVSKAGAVATYAELDAGIQSITAELKYATGTVTAIAKESYDTFYNDDGSQNIYVSNLITVTGLAFRPRIIRYRKTVDWYGLYSFWSEKEITGNYNVVRTCEDDVSSGTDYKESLFVQDKTTGVKYAELSPLKVTDSSFIMPAYNGASYSWEAWG